MTKPAVRMSIKLRLTPLPPFAAYCSSPKLPKQLEPGLPSPGGRAREFSLVELRSDLERAFRQLTDQHDLLCHSADVGGDARTPRRGRRAAAGVTAIGDTQRMLNAAAHRADFSIRADTAALEAGTRFLEEQQTSRDLNH